MEDKKVKTISKQQFNITICFDEEEASALHVLTLWGVPAFIKVCSEGLGSDIKKHTNGITKLFDTMKKELPPHIEKIKKARKIFEEE